MLHQALDHGINYFDTADAYAEGDSERLLGEAFRSQRARVVIATKGGYVFREQTVTSGRLQPLRYGMRRLYRKLEGQVRGRGNRFSQQDFSAHYLTRAVEESLRRLQTDYIDVYQLHGPTLAQAQLGEVQEAFHRLRQSGKVRYFGVGLERLDEIAEWVDAGFLDALQLPFGLLDPEAKHATFPLLARAGVGLIARGAYGGGLLKAGIPPAKLRTMTPKWPRIQALHDVATRSGRSIYELALHYVLHSPEIGVVLLGMQSSAQLASNLRCVSSEPLDATTFSALEVAIR